MAVKLSTARTTFLQAITEFPRWMSIRKRPEKSTSGLFLKAIIEEQTDIVEELNKFIKEFFLISYVGKESTIADYVYIVQVGNISYEDSAVTKPALPLTIDPKFFLNNMSSYVLYQDGYLIISTDNVPDDNVLSYTYNNYKYGGILTRYHIWNIFDEFAMFLGLERYSDTGETNAQLLRRCLRVFANPTNSTKTGLQNVILNCLSNDVILEREDILIEVPDDNNMWLSYDDSTVYEHFIQLNQDIWRTKVFDATWYEHTFKNLAYLSHFWDKALDVYTDGVGQRDDLKVELSGNKGSTTSVTVLGFKQDKISLDTYFRRHNVRDVIPIQLVKYNDVLNPKRVQYKIAATPAIKIEPSTIYLKEQIRKQGVSLLYIQDIIVGSPGVAEVNTGALQKGKTYDIVFKAEDDYSDMRINKCLFTDGLDIKNLLEENRVFKFNGTSLVHSDVKLHVSHVADLKDYTNLVDVQDGFTLGQECNTATFKIDVTGYGGKTVKISSYGTLFNLTEQTDLWKLSGLSFKNRKLVSTTERADNGSATLTVHCMAYSVKIARSSAQGSCNVQVKINDIIDSTLSGVLSSPVQTMSANFDILTKVQLTFTKQGAYPFEIEVSGTKYDISYSLSQGSLIQGPVSNYLSDVPDSVPNTLTVTVNNYDVVPPVIKYVHIGPSTVKTNYTVKNVKANHSNAHLDIDTVCKVSLYEVIDNKRTLISDNFSTKRQYVNDGLEEAHLEVNLEQFASIESSSVTVHKTVYAGKTTTYITLRPDEKISSFYVNGITFHERARRSIAELLNINSDYNVYISRNVNGFIVRNTVTNEEQISAIQRNNLTDANIFSYEGLSGEMSGVFVVDTNENIKMFVNDTVKNFETTFLTLPDAQEYISYNELTMYKKAAGDLEDITVDTTNFYPALPVNALMLYQISVIENVDGFKAAAVFKKYSHGNTNFYGLDIVLRSKLENVISLYQDNASQTEIEAALAEIAAKHNFIISYGKTTFTDIQALLNNGSWSLGLKEIYITTDTDLNNVTSINTEIITADQIMSLSSDIPLERTMIVEGKNVDLCRYVIKPPSYMTVIYSKTDSCIENSNIIKEDGFNKLEFSNVIPEDITVLVDNVEYNNFTLLPEEGILVWNDVIEVVGLPFVIAYYYKVPTSLSYNSLSYLYKKASFNVDAYLPVELNTDINGTYEDGDIFFVSWTEPVDYVPAPECDNPNFIALYDQGMITVRRIYDDNKILVNAGYYYDEGEEYYLYNHVHTDIIDKYSNVQFHNVKKLDVMFKIVTETNNWVRRSDFKGRNNQETLCYVNFSDPVIDTKGFSNFNELTACNSLNMWHCNDMSVELTAGLKDVGLLFTAESKNAYAIINVTPYVSSNSVISAFASQDISMELYREVKLDNNTVRLSMFAEPVSVFERQGSFLGYQFKEDIDLSYSYYVVVKGTGIIDDIIIKDNVTIENQTLLHVKNIENFGFSVSETETAGTVIPLAFDTAGGLFADLEVTKANVLQTSSNVKFGVTSIFDSRNCYDSLISDVTVVRQKNTFMTEDKNGNVKTPWFYLENNANVVELYVKVNNLVYGSMKNFNVVIKTADDELGTNEKTLNYVQKTNVASVNGKNLSSYVSVEIEMDPDKQVDTIEIFVKYGELGIKPLAIHNYKHGTFISKVYDLLSVNSYQFKRIDGICNDVNKVKLFIRGCRKQDLYLVWTDWYEAELSTTLEASQDFHIFDNYKLLQFKIEINDDNATLDIKNFIMEVVR